MFGLFVFLTPIDSLIHIYTKYFSTVIPKSSFKVLIVSLISFLIYHYGHKSLMKLEWMQHQKPLIKYSTNFISHLSITNKALCKKSRKIMLLQILLTCNSICFTESEKMAVKVIFGATFSTRKDSDIKIYLLISDVIDFSNICIINKTSL